ncbi:MAG: hypothetical protein IKF72_14380 [Kiritimatiellae bacterium]|nr:hypothetical protein [Kiritimatiellia bacterium]
MRRRKVRRSECVVLPLVLKRQWYRMIDSGVKRIEFREVKPYWDARVANWIRSMLRDDKIPVLEFRAGYGRFSPRMTFLSGGDVYAVLDGTTPVQHKELGEFPKKRYVFFIGKRVEVVG